jgi:hypothetical protein
MQVTITDTALSGGPRTVVVDEGATIRDLAEQVGVDPDAPNTKFLIGNRVSGLETELQEGDQVFCVRTGHKAA